jgi:DNA-binding NarL/FixJ family response regulator
MNQAKAAHIRILEAMPRDRIRTHFRQYDETGTGTVPRGRTLAATEQLHFRIKALDKRGLKRYQIAEELGVSRTTVQRHLDGKIMAVSR